MEVSYLLVSCFATRGAFWCGPRINLIVYTRSITQMKSYFEKIMKENWTITLLLQIIIFLLGLPFYSYFASVGIGAILFGQYFISMFGMMYGLFVGYGVALKYKYQQKIIKKYYTIIPMLSIASFLIDYVYYVNNIYFSKVNFLLFNKWGIWSMLGFTINLLLLSYDDDIEPNPIFFINSFKEELKSFNVFSLVINIINLTILFFSIFTQENDIMAYSWFIFIFNISIFVSYMVNALSYRWKLGPFQYQ